MIYTPLIRKAIGYAIKVHELDIKKKRKGKDIPYITHPFAVSLILSRVTKNDDIISAGLLHDTIEDCEPYGSVTKELLEKEFNKDVARMVDDVSEHDKTLPWFERKMAALKHIKNMRKDSLLVKSADVLHNLTELNDDIVKDGVLVFSKFNASKKDVILRYQKLIQKLISTWPDNPLLGDLKETLNVLLELVK